MVVLHKLGGIKVFGNGASVFLRHQGTVGGIQFNFDSDFFHPDVEENKLTLPCHRGELDYEIHVLETGDIHIKKDGQLYVCRTEKGRVCIDEYRIAVRDGRFVPQRHAG